MKTASRITETGGFTLVEAVVALSLSTVLDLLVTTVFMAQGDFYDDVLRSCDGATPRTTSATRSPSTGFWT